MLTSLQAAVVEALRDSAQQTTERLLRPRLVRAYGNELLRPETLLTLTPAVFAELREGTMRRESTLDHFDGDHQIDLICAVRSGLSEEDKLHEGARLMAWVVEVLSDTGIALDDGRHLAERLTYRRLGTNTEGTLWTGVLTPTFEKIATRWP